MATTTNYSWTTPDDTDLVKDGAAAIRTLGSSADTTVKNLNPGTTAGDIDYYTSSTAKARIAIGTAGQILRVNAGATAPEWAAPAGGKIKQVQFASLTTTATTTSTSFTDTGLSVSITPTSASNEILIFGMLPLAITGSGNGGFVTLTDGSNNNLINASSPGSRTPALVRLDPTADVMEFNMVSQSIVFKHSPATTSAFTYKVRFMVTGGDAVALLNRIVADTDNSAYSRGVATLVAMEYEV
jgi:hypothetical protein